MWSFFSHAAGLMQAGFSAGTCCSPHLSAFQPHTDVRFDRVIMKVKREQQCNALPQGRGTSHFIIRGTILTFRNACVYQHSCMYNKIFPIRKTMILGGAKQASFLNLPGPWLNCMKLTWNVFHLKFTPWWLKTTRLFQANDSLKYSHFHLSTCKCS